MNRTRSSVQSPLDPPDEAPEITEPGLGDDDGAPDDDAAPDDEPGTRVTENPWRPMDEAPKDRIVEGRFSASDEVGIKIRWRTSRHREYHQWVMGGVWHAADTAGAVKLNPIEWREWQDSYYHFPAPEEEAA